MSNAMYIYDLKRRMSLRYPRFASEIANANISFSKTLKYGTASTNGKDIILDEGYMHSLNEEESLFVVAHEFMHIKFRHIARMKENPDMDKELFNEAADAVINANLVEDGFELKDGYVDQPEAIDYTVMEYYNILLERKNQLSDERKNKSGKKSNKSSNDQNFNNNEDVNEGNSTSEQMGDNTGDGNSGEEKSNIPPSDHSFWTQSSSELEEYKQDSTYDEKYAFKDNRNERLSRAKDYFIRKKEEAITLPKFKNIESGESRVDWRLILRRELEKEETIWTQRRSIAENNYAYRLDDYVEEDEAKSEVLLDTSRSVSEKLIKEFLRELKPLLKESQIKAGCFSTNFYGFHEIKTDKDIEEFEIVGRQGTDFDYAISKFSKDPKVNKLVFTDGCGEVTRTDRYLQNIIWLVFNKSAYEKFRPTCGKVIYVPLEQLQHKESSLEKTM